MIGAKVNKRTGHENRNRNSRNSRTDAQRLRQHRTTTGTKQTVGGLLDAVGGAIAGSNIGSGKGKIAAVAAGTLLGALFGSEIGKSLDNADKAAMAQTTYYALENQNLERLRPGKTQIAVTPGRSLRPKPIRLHLENIAVNILRP